ncbi:DUF1801 domain-containing protein [Maribacter sp. 2307ULW6-5]|uniref:DUF1801 domain-containing protein n=1 Tax=Maribacter sp. 2307ULW6-5 TaxID=3386275 RepID=UPI0039BC800A
MEKKEKIREYYAQPHPFKEGMAQLRAIAQGTELEETYKWSFPTYTYGGKNVLAICKFKHHFGIWFFKGSSLPDKNKVLVNAQEGQTKHMRHWRFHSEKELPLPQIKEYMVQALAFEKEAQS